MNSHEELNRARSETGSRWPTSRRALRESAIYFLVVGAFALGVIAGLMLAILVPGPSP